MKAEDSKQIRVGQLERGQWLRTMLGEDRDEAARQLTPAAIERIRAHLEDEMDGRSSQAAA